MVTVVVMVVLKVVIAVVVVGFKALAYGDHRSELPCTK